VEVGTKLLVDCLNILKFCGLPPGYVCTGVVADYTLSSVPSHLTKHWVQSLLIILYKVNVLTVYNYIDVLIVYTIWTC